MTKDFAALEAEFKRWLARALERERQLLRDEIASSGKAPNADLSAKGGTQGEGGAA